VLVHSLNHPIFVASHRNLYEVVALRRMKTAGQESSACVNAHTPHDNIMGLRALYELKVTRFNRGSYDPRISHSFPDLKDTGNIVRLAVNEKGMRVQPNGEAIMIQKRKGALHTRLLK
jgi:hypothetical protein